MTLTQAHLKERLHYNPESGIFTWRECAAYNATWNSRFAGKVAGNTLRLPRRTYRRLVIDYVRYYAHRLAWLYVHGEMPEEPLMIDHINGDGTDNRIANLRAVTRSENMINRVGLEARNTSGHTGVSWYRTYQKWLAFITCNGRRKSLGYFDSKADAIAARKAAEEEYFPGITRAA